jgi:hypothetical protein
MPNPAIVNWIYAPSLLASGMRIHCENIPMDQGISYDCAATEFVPHIVMSLR